MKTEILSALEELLSRLRVSAQQQGDDTTVERPPKVLDDLTLDGVVKHIRKVEASDNSKSSQHFISNCQI